MLLRPFDLLYCLIVLSVFCVGNRLKPPDPHMRNFVSFIQRQGYESGTVCVLKDGRLVQLEKLTRHGSSRRPDTPIHLESLEQLILAAATLKLIQDRKLDLHHKPFNNLDASPSDPLRRVTIEQLLRHTSGIGRHQKKSSYESFSFRSDSGFNSSVVFVNFPGSKYDYSDFNYFLLMNVLSDLTENRLSEFLSKHIFVPLGLWKTHLSHTDHKKTWYSAPSDFVRLLHSFLDEEHTIWSPHIPKLVLSKPEPPFPQHVAKWPGLGVMVSRSHAWLNSDAQSHDMTVSCTIKESHKSKAIQEEQLCWFVALDKNRHKNVHQELKTIFKHARDWPVKDISAVIMADVVVKSKHGRNIYIKYQVPEQDIDAYIQAAYRLAMCPSRKTEYILHRKTYFSMILEKCGGNSVLFSDPLSSEITEVADVWAEELKDLLKRRALSGQCLGDIVPLSEDLLRVLLAPCGGPEWILENDVPKSLLSGEIRKKHTLGFLPKILLAYERSQELRYLIHFQRV